MMSPGTRHRLAVILATQYRESKSGSYAEFMRFIGDQKVKNPDTGRTVKYKSLKGPKGQELLTNEYIKWKDKYDAGEDKKSDGDDDAKKEPKTTKTSKPFKPLSLSTKEERDAYAAKWDESRLKWSPDQRDSLMMYTSSEYQYINSGLRSNNQDPRYKDTLEHLDKLFNSPEGKTKEPVTVFRGVDDRHPLVKLLKKGELKEGYTYEDPGYMSTTIKEDAFYIKDPHTFHIDVPEGTPGVYVGDPPKNEYSHYGPELEMILNRGTKVEVTKIDGKKIYCKVVPA